MKVCKPNKISHPLDQTQVTSLLFLEDQVKEMAHDDKIMEKIVQIYAVRLKEVSRVLR